MNCQPKQCHQCGRELPLSEFWRRKDTSNGYCYKCKECMKKNFKDWLRKNRKKRTEYQKDWRKKNLEKVIKIERDFRKNNKKYFRFIDHTRYHFSLDSECMLCESTENLMRHHPKYFNFDLEYAWIFCTLCFKCHGIEDEYRNEWIVEEI